MTNAIERLRSLRVSDAMARDVFQVASSQRMADVADQFVAHGLTSAPVSDEQGHCVGILSAADFIKRERAFHRAGEQSWTSDEHRLEQSDKDGPLSIVSVADDMVTNYMTRTVQTIDAEASLLKAAVIMNAEHLHRLPVLDHNQHVIGVVSTMDVVSALVNAIDEMDLSFLNELRG